MVGHLRVWPLTGSRSSGSRMKLWTPFLLMGELRVVYTTQERAPISFRICSVRPAVQVIRHEHLSGLSSLATRSCTVAANDISSEPVHRIQRCGWAPSALQARELAGQPLDADVKSFRIFSGRY